MPLHRYFNVEELKPCLHRVPCWLQPCIRRLGRGRQHRLRRDVLPHICGQQRLRCLPPRHSANDPADQGDTSCDVTLCAENEHVFGRTCVACPPGSTNAAGDQASWWGGTQCDPLTSCMYSPTQFLGPRSCHDCPFGTQRLFDVQKWGRFYTDDLWDNLKWGRKNGLPASESYYEVNSKCPDILCKVDEHVVNHV